MIRSAFAWALFVLYTIFIISSGVPSVLFGQARPAYRRVGRWWARGSLRIFGARYRVYGQERLNPDQNYIFIGNHISNVDTFLLSTTTRIWEVVFFAKKELFRIPVFGFALRQAGFIPMNRGDAREAMRELNKGIEYIKQEKLSTVVFAEGTRSKDGQLQEFKRGAFSLAVKTGFPVAPFVVRGTDKVMKRDSWRINFNREVSVTFLDPIDITGLTDKQLMGIVRERIEKEFHS